MSSPRPPEQQSDTFVTGVYESVLYAKDVPAAAHFYARVLGAAPLELDERGAVFRLQSGAMLLIFDPEHSSRTDRDIPWHGASGPGHIALSVDPQAIENVSRRLADLGIEVERREEWPAGGTSLYLRDPAFNSVELISGEAWA